MPRHSKSLSADPSATSLPYSERISHLLKQAFEFPFLTVSSASLIALSRIGSGLQPSVAAAILTGLCLIRLAPSVRESFASESRAQMMGHELGLDFNAITKKTIKRLLNAHSRHRENILSRGLRPVLLTLTLLCFYIGSDWALRLEPNPLLKAHISLGVSHEIWFRGIFCAIIMIISLLNFRGHYITIRFRYSNSARTEGIVEFYSLATLQSSLELGLARTNPLVALAWTRIAQWKARDPLTRELTTAILGLVDLGFATLLLTL